MTEEEADELAVMVAETTDPELLGRLADKASALAGSGDERGVLLGRLVRWREKDASKGDPSEPGFLRLMAHYEQAASDHERTNE